MHSTYGQQVLENFLYRGAGLAPTWTTDQRRRGAGRRDPRPGRRRSASSAGCPAAWTPRWPPRSCSKAVGDQLTCVFVDHGLLRKGEAEQVEKDFVAATGVRAEGRRRPGALPGRARRGDRPGGEAQDHRPGVHPGLRAGRAPRSSPRPAQHGEPVEFLVQGTLYPDVVESGGGTGTANIKSHHNVGGLPDDLQFQLVEPLRTLFKDEVRTVGEELGLPARDRLAPAVPRPGPRHPHRRRGHRASGSTCCARPTPSPARS